MILSKLDIDALRGAMTIKKKTPGIQFKDIPNTASSSRRCCFLWALCCLRRSAFSFSSCFLWYFSSRISRLASQPFFLA